MSARRTSIQTFATCSARIGGHREAIERSAKVSRVFLLVARVDEGWVTIPSYGNKNGSARFEPMSKYEKWLARPLAVLSNGPANFLAGLCVPPVHGRQYETGPPQNL
jgi:hypothetical protein